jgi:hypothetical protein
MVWQEPSLGDFALNWPGASLPTSYLRPICTMELTCHRSEEEAWVRLIGAQSCLQFPQRTLSLIPVQWIDSGWRVCA